MTKAGFLGVEKIEQAEVRGRAAGWRRVRKVVRAQGSSDPTPKKLGLSDLQPLDLTLEFMRTL